MHAYFERTGLSERDSPRMYLKTAVLLLWFGTSYALLVFGAATLWQGALLSLSLGLAMAGIGCAIQHDANHGAYSRRAAINRVMGMTLDMLGASSYLWRFKHNLAHHTYTNLVGRGRRHQLPPFRSAVTGPAALAPPSPSAVLYVGAVLVPVSEVELRRRLQDPEAGANLRAAVPETARRTSRPADRGQAAVHRVGVRGAAAVSLVVGRAAVLRHDIARPRHRACRSVHARPLR